MQVDKDHWFNRGRTKAKIMVSFWQILASFESVLVVRFPPVFEKFTRWISSTVNLDALQIARADCFVRTDFYVKLILQTLAPLVLSFLILVTYVIARLVFGRTTELRAKYRATATSSFFTLCYVTLCLRVCQRRFLPRSTALPFATTQ